ncbi:glycosyltransferase, partial [Pedobacter sp. HMWF019]|uniref:glycosyltransferase n=1 Tax=Pedobacter sp. HMWF019 TaxID=2056856 RepID=UPI0018EE687C
MSDKLISIALCTYNGEKFLKEQMDSLVHQDYPNLEIIVVDDCSSDRTIEILQSYSQRFSFIKIYQNTQNLGYIKNFEKAIHLCTGELIALSDQDDIWMLNKISKMYSSIGDNILLYHDSEFITEQGETMQCFISDIRIFYQGNDSRYFLFENCVSGHAIVFKKELRNYIGSFPNGIYHDWWLAYA